MRRIGQSPPLWSLRATGRIRLLNEARPEKSSRAGPWPLWLQAPCFLDGGRRAHIRREGACNNSVGDMFGHAVVAVIVLVQPVTGEHSLPLCERNETHRIVAAHQKHVLLSRQLAD